MPSTPTLTLFADAPTSDAPANILAAARTLAIHLARSRALDRRLVSEVMTNAFGASDAEGGWNWRDAYDAIEAATVLQIRRLAPQIARLEDAPAEIATLLASVSALGLTHSRRSEAQVALDQFSTPPELAALVVLAAQVRPEDAVLEPSAGTGLIGAVAEACGGVLSLNEIAPTRAGLLDGLFPKAARSRHDGRHLHDLLATAGAFDVALCNPPFSDLQAHLVSALKALSDGGRMAAIVPLTALSDSGLRQRLERHGVMTAAVVFPARAFSRHGTSVETGLLVMDRGTVTPWDGRLHQPEDLAAAARLVATLPGRATARPRARVALHAAAVLAPRERGLALPSGRLAFLTSAAPLTASAWTDDRIDRLKTLWLEGQTADQIARTLANGITRSAVLGKVYRMGLSAGRSAGPSKAGSRPGPSPIPPACPAAAEPVVPVAAAADAPSGREVGGAPLQSIGRSECRWPLGEPNDVLEALEHVVGDVGHRVRIGVDADGGHDARNPFGSRGRPASFEALASDASALAAAVLSRAVILLLCGSKARCTQSRSSASQGRDTAQSPFKGSNPSAFSSASDPSVASSSYRQ